MTIPRLACVCLLLGALPAQQRFFSGKPERVDLGAPTGSSDYTMAMNVAETQLVFGSNRPGGKGGLDLWIATRAKFGDPWTVRRALAEQSSADDEFAPSLSPDGLELYFTSTRGGQARIYGARRQDASALAFGAPAEITVTTAANAHTRDPQLTLDGTKLFFASTESGGGDIYLVSRTRQQNTWTPWGGKTRFAPASTPGSEERAPMPDYDGHVVWFTRRGTSYDHWMVWRHLDTTWSTPMSITELNTNGNDSHLYRAASSFAMYGVSPALNDGTILTCICENGPSLPVPGTPTDRVAGAARAISDRPVDFRREVSWRIGTTNVSGFYSWDKEAPINVWVAMLGTPLAGPVKLLPFGGLLEQQPIHLTPLLATPAPDSYAVSVPNNPALRGLYVWLQALGLTSKLKGAFTPVLAATVR